MLTNERKNEGRKQKKMKERAKKKSKIGQFIVRDEFGIKGSTLMPSICGM